MNILARALSSNSSGEDASVDSENDFGPVSGADSDKESRARGEVEVSPNGKRVYAYGEKKLKWDIGDKGANDRIQANAVKLTERSQASMRINGRPVKRGEGVYPSPLEFESIKAYHKEVPQTVQFGDSLRRIMLARKFREASGVTFDKKKLELVNIADAERSYESFQRALDEDELFAPKEMREHFFDYPEASTEEERILHRSRMNRNIDRAHGYIADNMEQSQEIKYRILQKRETQKQSILNSGLEIRNEHPKPEEEEEDDDDGGIKVSGSEKNPSYSLDLTKISRTYLNPFMYDSDDKDDDAYDVEHVQEPLKEYVAKVAAGHHFPEEEDKESGSGSSDDDDQFAVDPRMAADKYDNDRVRISKVRAHNVSQGGADDEMWDSRYNAYAFDDENGFIRSEFEFAGHDYTDWHIGYAYDLGNMDSRWEFLMKESAQPWIDDDYEMTLNPDMMRYLTKEGRELYQYIEDRREWTRKHLCPLIKIPNPDSIPDDEDNQPLKAKLLAEYDALIPKVKLWREEHYLNRPKAELVELERQRIEDTLTPEEKANVAGVKIAVKDAIFTKRVNALRSFILDDQNPYLEDFVKKEIPKEVMMEKLPADLNEADRELVSSILDDFDKPVTPDEMEAYVRQTNRDLVINFASRFSVDMNHDKDYDAHFDKEVSLTIDWSQFMYKNWREHLQSVEGYMTAEDLEAIELAKKYCIESAHTVGDLYLDNARAQEAQRKPSLSNLRVDSDGREYYSYQGANTVPVNPFIAPKVKKGYAEESSRTVKNAAGVKVNNVMTFSDSDVSGSGSDTGLSDSDAGYKEETNRAVRSKGVVNSDDEAGGEETAKKMKSQGPLNRMLFNELEENRGLGTFLGDYYDGVGKVSSVKSKIVNKYYKYSDRHKHLTEQDEILKARMATRDLLKEHNITYGSNPVAIEHVDEIVGDEYASARNEMAEYNPLMHEFLYGDYEGEHERLMSELEQFVEELNVHKRVLLQRGARISRGGFFDKRTMTITLERKFVPDAMLDEYDKLQTVLRSLRVWSECLLICERNLNARVGAIQKDFEKRDKLNSTTDGNATVLNEAFIHTEEMNEFIQNVIMYRHLRLFLLAPYQASEVYEDLSTSLKNSGIEDTTAPLTVLTALHNHHPGKGFKIKGNPKDKNRFNAWKDQAEYKNTTDFIDDGAELDLESKLVDTTVYNALVDIDVKLNKAQRSIDKYLAASKSRKDYIKRELNVAYFYLERTFRSVHFSEKEKPVEPWDELYMEKRENSTRYKRRRTDLGVPDENEPDGNPINDGWIHDPTYDITDFLKDESEATEDFAAWQERLGKEELEKREEAQKEEFLIYRDEVKDMVKTHDDYWLIKDYTLDQQLAMIGYHGKYVEREDKERAKELVDPADYFMREAEKEDQKLRDEIDFHVYNWLPRDAKYVDGVKTNLDVVYNAEDTFAFRDVWDDESQYRCATDYEVGGRTAFESTKGNVEYEQKKSFFDACAAEIDKRLRLKDRPRDQLDEHLMKKKLAVLMKSNSHLKPGGQKKCKSPVDLSSRGHGGRKEAFAKAKLTPVYPVIPKIIRHPMYEQVIDETGKSIKVENGSTGQDLNNIQGLIPIPDDIIDTYEEMIESLKFTVPNANGFPTAEALEEEEKRVRNADKSCPLMALQLREEYYDMDLTSVQGDPFLRNEEDQHFHAKLGRDRRDLEMRSGGLITINGRPLSQYFPSAIDRFDVIAPLVYTGVVGNFDVDITVNGGGTSGQSQAIRLAVTRALLKQYPHFKKSLRCRGFVTRDPRVVERKKPGRHKARRGFQWVKR